MDALFIGHAYIDVTFLTDHLPSGDEKYVAQDYAISFGGNAVTASFCCAKLGVAPDLISPLAGDWLGRMFIDMAAKYSISVHGRKVAESSLSFIMPKGGQRAIVRCRDDHYIHPFPQLNLDGCRVLHVDGHQADAALHYARACREAGILTSLDGGGVCSNSDELLRFIDVAVVSEDFTRQLGLETHGALDFLAAHGCQVSGVTLGERGMLWREGKGEIRHLPALDVPADRIVDTNGAGDIFHGAYVYSYLATPQRGWAGHFEFARAASAHSVQFLGNEASLPALADIEAAAKEFAPKA